MASWRIGRLMRVYIFRARFFEARGDVLSDVFSSAGPTPL